MRDPAFRAKLLAESHEPLRSDMAARLTDYDRMFPLGDPPNYEPAQDSSLGAQARRENRDPREVVYDYLIEGEGKNFIFAPFANFAAYNLDCCSEMMQSPHTLIGLGDGGAHVGIISDGCSRPRCWPTGAATARQAGSTCRGWSSATRSTMPAPSG